MDITIITDNIDSWFIPYGYKLKNRLEKYNHKVDYVFNKNEIKKGDICFILSCSRIIEQKYLDLNTNNIVVHASDLPEGKGFSPMQWQILEGKDEIIITLFEAVKEVDAGPYYLKKVLKFEGTELYNELRYKLGKIVVEMCLDFVNSYNKLMPIAQNGNETFYRKRTSKDDELDPHKSIAEQFNHFRIADNENYPLWFEYKGRKYVLKIFIEE